MPDMVIFASEVPSLLGCDRFKSATDTMKVIRQRQRHEQKKHRTSVPDDVKEAIRMLTQLHTSAETVEEKNMTQNDDVNNDVGDDDDVDNGDDDFDRVSETSITRRIGDSYVLIKGLVRTVVSSDGKTMVLVERNRKERLYRRLFDNDAVLLQTYMWLLPSSDFSEFTENLRSKDGTLNEFWSIEMTRTKHFEKDVLTSLVAIVGNKDQNKRRAAVKDELPSSEVPV
jgi:hypothetical protein